MRDSNLVARDGGAAGNLTTTFTSPWIDLGKGGVLENDLDWLLVVPQATGTTPTLDIKADLGDDGSTSKRTESIPQINAAITRGIRVPTRFRYIRWTLTVGGTSPNFGAVDLRGSTGVRITDYNVANS